MTGDNTTLIASLKTLPRAAWILFLGTFLNKFGTFVIPFFALYLTRQGYSMAEAGFALGAYGAGHLLPRRWAGNWRTGLAEEIRLSCRWSPRPYS